MYIKLNNYRANTVTYAINNPVYKCSLSMIDRRHHILNTFTHNKARSYSVRICILN